MSPTVIKPVLVNNREELWLVFDGLVRFVENLSEELREQVKNELFDEALKYWHEHKLQPYDVTQPGDEQTFYRTRPLTVADAVQHVLMQRAGISTDHYELFPMLPVTIWHELEERMIEQINFDGDYPTELTGRRELAKQDYRQHGDHY